MSYESVKGGFGARPDRDGINAIASGISNTMNTPVEIIEMSFPVRVEEYALRPDSGGAGRFRGGLGARRTWRVLERDTRATVCCERTKSAPFGIAGGAAGAPARISVVEPDGAERVLNSKGSFDAPAGRWWCSTCRVRADTVHRPNGIRRVFARICGTGT